MRGRIRVPGVLALSALVLLALAADAVSLSGRKAAHRDPHSLVELQSNAVLTNLPNSKLKPLITLKKLFGPEEASSACSQPSPTDDFSCAGVTPDVGWPHRNDFPSCHACQGNRGTFLKCCFQANKAEFLEVASKLLKYSLFDPAGCRDLPWPSYFMCAFGAVAAKDSSVPKGWIDEMDAPAKKNAHLGCQKLVTNAKTFFREEAVKDPKLQASLRKHVTKMNVLERVCSETEADLEAAMRTAISNGPNLKASGTVGASKDSTEHAKPRAIPNLLDPSSFPLPFALVHGPDAPPSYYGHHRPAALPVFTSAARRTGNARERPLGTFPVQDFAVGEQQPRCAAVYGHCQHPSVGCSGRYITGRCAGSFGYECCVSYMGMDLLRTQQHMAYLLAHPTGMKPGEGSEAAGAESSNGAAPPKAAGGKAAPTAKAGAKAPAAGESAAPAAEF